ncbi:hypothetical protein PDJAM_G00109720, partial [Pangasius djambal]|nr:hypothetical protein [Pangasius djambal]
THTPWRWSTERTVHYHGDPGHNIDRIFPLKTIFFFAGFSTRCRQFHLQNLRLSDLVGFGLQNEHKAPCGSCGFRRQRLLVIMSGLRLEAWMT